MTQPKIDHFEAVRPDSIVQVTVDGVSCYAFTVRPGDVQIWDRAAGNAGGSGEPNERAEISYAPAPDTEKFKSPYNVREGMTQTYDVDYRFKAGWPTHDPAQHAWGVLTQFHPQPNAKGIQGFGGAAVANMAIRYYNPDGSGAYFAEIPIKPDVWIKVRMVVKWSAGKDGYAVIQGRTTGALIGRFSGPTIAAGEWKYLKQGYYRAGGLPEGTVYQTQIDISEGDLTLAVTPPAAGVDVKKATAGLQALVDTRAQLEKVTLPAIDAKITELQKLRDDLMARDKQIAAALDAGDWGGGVVAK